MSAFLDVLNNPRAFVIGAVVACTLAGYLLSFGFPVERGSRPAATGGRGTAGEMTSASQQGASVASDVEAAKHDLDGRAAKLETFKQGHPEITGNETAASSRAELKAKLAANRKVTRQVRQDRAYARSLLEQQLSGSAGATLSATSDIKAKPGDSLEVQRLRFQIRQYDDQIAGATRDELRLKKQLQARPGKQQVDSKAQQQYDELTKDYDSAQKTYSTLLARNTAADPEGDPVAASSAATVGTTDDSEDSNRRLWFAGAGLACGLAVGIGLAIWLRAWEKTLRTARDVQTILQAPLLVSVPWVARRNSAADSKNSALPAGGSTAGPENDTIEV